MILNTKRLNIRPFRSDDIEDTFEIYTDADVCRYLLEDEWNTEDKEEFEKKIKNNKLEENSSLNLAVVLDKKVIGDISVWYTGMKQTVEIGFVFNPKFSGKGYANESVETVIKKLFAEYNIHRIQANLDARNIASKKLCQNLGMRQEAHFIKDYWNKGEWTDSFVFGMLITDLKK
ncbi:GNAT family N-acetyltransferase [Streptococcus suis]|uniref:GNAT family N-acetyltransferase n=1 Tax=Streptococcus suis TaxID=1307 RepID=UPI0019607347|nr:GNAT family N-acetyltransferase [Streptococcus suis]MBM7180840.1 GNAT family N-acetyltransferase [Streptococcus suis]